MIRDKRRGDNFRKIILYILQGLNTKLHKNNGEGNI